MKTATGTKNDDDADRLLRERRGMKLVTRPVKRKIDSGFRIGVSDDIFAEARQPVVPPQKSRADEKTEISSPVASGTAKNLALAAAVGLIVGLLLGRRDR